MINQIFDDDYFDDDYFPDVPPVLQKELTDFDKRTSTGKTIIVNGIRGCILDTNKMFFSFSSGPFKHKIPIKLSRQVLFYPEDHSRHPTIEQLEEVYYFTTKEIEHDRRYS